MGVLHISDLILKWDYWTLYHQRYFKTQVQYFVEGFSDLNTDTINSSYECFQYLNECQDILFIGIIFPHTVYVPLDRKYLKIRHSS